MKKFDVYQHPVKGYKAVKQGFSWPACLLSFVWLLYNKMWFLASMVISILVLLSVTETMTLSERSREYDIFLSYAKINIIGLIFGWCGNNWLRNHLQDNGFEKISTVEAESNNSAMYMVANNQLEVSLEGTVKKN